MEHFLFLIIILSVCCAFVLFCIRAYWRRRWRRCLGLPSPLLAGGDPLDDDFANAAAPRS